MSRKENVNMRSLKHNGMVTFTTDGPDLQGLLEGCKQQNIKVVVRRFHSFVTVVLE